jgi:hypothetical protein
MNRKRRSSRVRLEKTGISDRELEALTNTPEYYDEESFGGSMPNPESDDDTLKSQQEYGFYTEIDTPEQEEMDTQKQLDQAERARRRQRE